MTVLLSTSISNPRFSWCHDTAFKLILEDGQLPTIGTAPGVQRYSGSDECMMIAARWLKTCLEHHKLCQKDDKAGSPSRVIDLGTEPDLRPRLIDISSAVSAYIALSYCWGEDQTLITTTENISAYMAGLDLITLPKVYRDLMTMTRALKVRYVWIDALCIIQDDAKDWVREASKMCSVYENAVMTISADCSPGVRHGIFSEQSYATPPSALSYQGVRVNVRQSLQRKHSLRDPFDNIDFDNLDAPIPLYRRARCLQETVLSTRTLHFTGKELMWECNEAYDCECRFQKTVEPEMCNRTFRRPEILGQASKAESFDKWDA